MKHKLSKLTSLFLAVAMALAMAFTAVPAKAAGEGDATPTTYKLTLTKTTKDHTYAVYQIYTGDLSTDANGNKVLSNIKYGSNYSGKTAGADVPDTEITALKKKSGDEAANSFTVADDPVATVTSTGEKTEITGLVPGYYLVKETTETVPDKETISKNILQVVGDTSIEVKSGTTTSDKKVKEKNDTTGETTGWQDAADYDIGDKVPFKLTATVASDYANYTKGYKLTFHDKESEGLTFDATSVKVYVGADSTQPIDSKYYTVTTTGLTDGCKFEVHFENLKDVPGVEAGTVIRVEYESQLNEHAKIGSEGNPNESHITYTNNPNTEQVGENGKTPDDKVTVFTYDIKARKVKYTDDAAIDQAAYNKLDETAKADYVKVGDKYQKVTSLEGAGFTLYKKGPNAADGSETWTAVKEIAPGTTKPTTFEFKATDAGTYKLVETTVPEGYNKAEDIIITVAATYDTDSNNPKLTSLTVDPATAGFTVSTTTVENSDAITTNGEVTGKIVNKAGSTLPSTGGIGTTIFYVVGGILVAGAAILLITRRRTER